MCKTYLITLVLTALCGVMYIGVDILLSNKAFRKTEHLILLITSVICLSIYLLPISIYCDPVTHIVYTYGSSALMTYLGAVGLILLNFALILKYRRQIRCAQTHRNVTLDARMDTLSDHPVFKS